MQIRSFPEIGFVRLPEIIGDQNNPGVFPVSRSTWYQGAADGRFPKPVKLSERVAAWRVEDIRALIESYGE